jgi:RNA polymerase sigma-70 factor (ECF subfamily)
MIRSAGVPAPVDLFLAATRAIPSASERVAIASALDRQLAAARTTWAGVDVPSEDVVAVWAERLAGGDPPALAAAIDDLRATDLYIACGCGAGDPAALAAFETRYFAGLDSVLSRIAPAPAAIAEVTQILREKLFVADPTRRPRIVDMAGRGDLSGLIRVAAIRTALNLRRAEARRAGVLDERAELALLRPEDAPELAAIRAQHRALLKEALEHAILALPPRDRAVLRMHLVEHLGIDEIGHAHEVHRATAARWLQRIRDDLRGHTLRRLHARLGASDDEVASLVRAVDSRLDVSFARLLATPS